MSDPTEYPYTQGPWRTGDPADAGEFEIWGADSASSNGHTVADVSSFYRPAAECEANARLIAAAPQLYEALAELHHECIAAAERAGTTWPLSGPAKSLDDKVRVALRKAVQ